MGKGENYLTKKSISCKTDEDTHLNTLIVKPDNTFVVKIDGEEEATGNLKEDFDMLKPKEIDNPESSKPADWVDETHIVDPEAEKPEDWDDEMDGEWEAPQIDNPEYKGAWSAKRIDNPEYKGVWVHDQVANPEYEDDDELYSYEDFGAIGIDIWQVKSGTVFDSILVTDDVATADAAVADFKTVVEEEKKEAEAKKAAEEEEAAKKKAEEEEKADEETPTEDADESDSDEEKKDEL